LKGVTSATIEPENMLNTSFGLKIED